MSDFKSSLDSSSAINFEDPSIYHDRILVVGERKFYVVAGVLSMWSEYFRTMFNGEFKEGLEREIPLKEVNSNVFLVFLKLLYLRDSSVIEAHHVSPLICLAHFYLAPCILAACKNFIDKNFDNLDDLKLELLKKACIYGIEDVKEKLVLSCQNDKFLGKFSCADTLKIAVEHSLDTLKDSTTAYIAGHLTHENCCDYLDICAKFDLTDLKIKISEGVKKWSWGQIPLALIIKLAKAAFKYDVHILKWKLRERIFHLAEVKGSVYIYKRNNQPQPSVHTFNWFLVDNCKEIFDLPEEVSQFIIISTCQLEM